MKIAFDVDDCLILQARDGHEFPNHKVVDLARWFISEHHDVIIWSGGGVDYARRFAERIGLSFCRIIEKGSEEVDIAVDDQDIPPEGVKAKVIIKV